MLELAIVSLVGVYREIYISISGLLKRMQEMVSVASHSPINISSYDNKYCCIEILLSGIGNHIFAIFLHRNTISYQKLYFIPSRNKNLFRCKSMLKKRERKSTNRKVKYITNFVQ